MYDKSIAYYGEIEKGDSAEAPADFVSTGGKLAFGSPPSTLVCWASFTARGD